MPDVIAQVNELKGLPDQALQHELVSPSGAMPAYLVLAEAQRRQLMRQSAVTSQNQAPVGSVYDDVIRSMMARQPPQGAAPAGATPPAAAPPGAPQTPQNFKPPTPMAEGGEVEDDDEDPGESDSDIVEMPLKPGALPSTRPASLDDRLAGLRKSPLPADNYDDELEAAGKAYKLDPDLGRAVMHIESSERPGAVGPRTRYGEHAMGLMQLMPGTAADMGVTDPYDPHQNIWGGMRYLRQMLDRYDGDIPKALAAYNAGPGKVPKTGEIPSFTHDYVTNVMGRYNYLKDPDMQGKGTDLSMFAPLTPPHPTQAFTSPWDWERQKAEGSLDAPDSQAPGQLAMNPQIAQYFAAPPQAAPQAAPAPTVAAAGAAPTPAATAAAGPYDPDNIRDSYSFYSKLYDPDQEKLRAQIKKMWDEAEARKKPGFWSYLENFGAGMATTPARNWGQALAGGAAGMVKGVAAQQDAARKQELELLGVSSKLDDQARLAQGKAADAAAAQARIQQQAINTAATKSQTDQQRTMTEILKGRTQAGYQPWGTPVPAGLEPIRDLANPTMQYVVTPATKQLTDPKLMPFAAGRKLNDTIPYAEYRQIEAEAAKGAAKPQGAIKLTGADALIATSLGFDANNLTADQAQKVLDKKNKSDVTNLADIDPGLIKQSLSGANPPGWRNEALFQSLQPGEQSLVRQLTDYKAILPVGSAQREPTIRRAISLAGLYDPSFDASAYGRRQKLSNDYVSTNGKAGASIGAIGTVSDHIARMEQNWQALNNYGGLKTPLNAPINWWKQFTGDPHIGPILLDQEAVGTELMRAWRQVGAGSDKDIERWQKALSPNASPASQASAVNEMYGLLEGKIKELKEQYETGMGRPWDFHMLNPDVKKRIAAHGIDVSDITPGATYGSSLPFIDNQTDYEKLPKGAAYMTNDGPQIKK